jgi:hypothetical protein
MAEPSGVEYRCELKPLWLAADLVEKMKMGHVQIRSYKNSLMRLGMLRERKRSFRKCMSSRRLSISVPTLIWVFVYLAM